MASRQTVRKTCKPSCEAAHPLDAQPMRGHPALRVQLTAADLGWWIFGCWRCLVRMGFSQTSLEPHILCSRPVMSIMKKNAL